MPVRTAERERGSGTESDDSSARSVRFSKLAEVRQMSETEAAEALLARLSYQASARVRDMARRAAAKLPALKVAKVALVFCLLVRSPQFFADISVSSPPLFTYYYKIEPCKTSKTSSDMP